MDDVLAFQLLPPFYPPQGCPLLSYSSSRVCAQKCTSGPKPKPPPEDRCRIGFQSEWGEGNFRGCAEEGKEGGKRKQGQQTPFSLSPSPQSQREKEGSGMMNGPDGTDLTWKGERRRRKPLVGTHERAYSFQSFISKSRLRRQRRRNKWTYISQEVGGREVYELRSPLGRSDSQV